MVELWVFMLTSLLLRVGVVKDREGSNTLPYSCSLPKTTDSLSYSIYYESTIERIYSTSSIFFKDFFYSLKLLTFDFPISPKPDFFVSIWDLLTSILDFNVYLLVVFFCLLIVDLNDSP